MPGLDFDWRVNVNVPRFLALAAIAAATARASAAEPLRVSAIPDESPTELIRKFKPLGDYLEKRLGMEVKFLPVTDYPATVEGLAAGKLDLVWYGGFTFVQARRRTGNAIPLVQREEDARFHSKFITSAGLRGEGARRPQGQDLRLRVRQLDLRPPHAALLPAPGRHRPRQGLRPLLVLGGPTT